MFGLPISTFYPNTISNSYLYFPSNEMNTAHFLTSTPNGKRKYRDSCLAHVKKLCQNPSDRPIRKSSFDIESLLDLKATSQSIAEQSYNDDTEDGSSDDGETSFRSPTLSSLSLFNPLKTLDMSIQSNNSKTDLTPSSSSESEHSPYRLSSTKQTVGTRHNTEQKGKPKRIRTIFTPEQLERLESEFDKQQYMVGNERFYLATTLDLTEAQVKVWFQNRRIKWRRQALDDHQQRLNNLVGHVSNKVTRLTTSNNAIDDDHHSNSNQ